MPPGSGDSSREATTWVNSERLASPVSGSCRAWWWSSSLSRPSCSSDCSSWPFSRAIAVWLASVSNSFRSSASNVLRSLSGSETKSVPTSVDSPRSGATSARRVFRPRRSDSSSRREVDQAALAFGHGADEQRIVERRADRLHDLDPVARPDLAAQDVVAFVARQQPDLGHVRAEHLAGMIEQAHQRGVELRAPLQDPGRLVQELDALVLLALRDVGAIGQRRGDRRQHEQPDRLRVRPQRRSGPSARCSRWSARRRSRSCSISGMRRYCGVPSASEIAVLTLSTPMRFSTRATSRTAAQIEGPNAWPGVTIDVDDPDRDHRGQAELGEVEGELDPPLAPVDDQGDRGADQSGGDEGRRASPGRGRRPAAARSSRTNGRSARCGGG